MLILKHLKTLQRVSSISLIIFRELVGSLLKTLNLKSFINFINMTVKHNNNILNLITGCLYVSSFGLHVSVNFMTIIRSIRAKIYDTQQSFSWNAMGSNWVLHYSV
jgi:hypothetical protein